MSRAVGLTAGGALASPAVDEAARLLFVRAVRHFLDGLADELPQVGPQIPRSELRWLRACPASNMFLVSTARIIPVWAALFFIIWTLFCCQSAQVTVRYQLLKNPKDISLPFFVRTN